MAEEDFKKYYTQLAANRGWPNNPDDPRQFYDMRKFYELAPRQMIYEALMNPKGHFPDTFKMPGHPTMSLESRNWAPGVKAGKWGGGVEGEVYKPLPTAYDLLFQMMKGR